MNLSEQLFSNSDRFFFSIHTDLYPTLVCRHGGCFFFVIVLLLTVLQLTDRSSHADSGRPSGVIVILLFTELWGIGGVQVTGWTSKQPLHLALNQHPPGGHRPDPPLTGETSQPTNYHNWGTTTDQRQKTKWETSTIFYWQLFSWQANGT